METTRTSRATTRRYNLGDAEDRAKLEVLRQAMLTRTSRVIGSTFDELRFDYRIGRKQLRRICGPGFVTKQAARKSNFQHDAALGLIRLRSAIAAGAVGKWQLRTDGTRVRLNLADVPDMHFNAVLDWLRIIEFVSAEGWSYTAFGELVGATRSQISKLSWGRSSPRMVLGESILWGARYVRDGLVIPPVQSAMARRRPESRRTVRDDERTQPWWFPDPISEDAAP